jgi:hypothetical protein
MITLWTILGRAALDGEYRATLTKLADKNDIKKSLMTYLQDNGNRISLFEVWELARFFNVDSKQNKPTLPQVQAVYKTVADPKTGTPSPELCAVVGMALIDLHAVSEIDGKKGDRPKLDRFLTRDPHQFHISVLETQLILDMFNDPNMYKLCEQFHSDQWEDFCEEGATYAQDYDKIHPTGPDVTQAGSWYNFVWLVSLLDQDDLMRRIALNNNARFLKRCAADPTILPKLQEIVCPTCASHAVRPAQAAKKKAAAKKAVAKKAAVKKAAARRPAGWRR